MSGQMRLTLHGTTYPDNAPVSASVKIAVPGYGLNDPKRPPTEIAIQVKIALDALSFDDIEKMIRRMRGEES